MWESIENFIFKATQIVLILTIGALIFLGIPYGIFAWATYVPPETFALRVDSWACTNSHVERHCSKGCYERMVCDQWRRK